MNISLIGICIFPFISFSCFGSYSIKEMTLEEKVGQLLMAHFNGEQPNDAAQVLIQNIKVGGIIYYNWSNGLHSPKQIQALSIGLQELAASNSNPIPLLIAVDQEGGIVSRSQAGFTKFPGNRALGETCNPNLAEEVAFVIGEELLAVGINMNLAPVVDVSNNPRNPVIGVRSFGDDVETVLAFGKKSLEGYRKAQVITTLKHFPGHGDVDVDPHEDLPVVRKLIEELERVELLPFAQLASSADVIMTAHILVPAFDTVNCSTLSEKTLTYLRQKIGFKGVIIADSLVMEGVVKQCHTVDEAAIQALNAGCDILILGGKLLVGEKIGFELTVADVQRIHNSIISAVKTGRIKESRINESVARILNLKNQYLIFKNRELEEGVLTNINCEAHRQLAQDVACIALKCIENRVVTSLNEKKLFLIAPKLVEKEIDQTSLPRLGKSTVRYFYENLSPSQDEIEAARQRAASAEVLFICSYNAWGNRSQIALIQALLNMGKPVVLLVMRDPVDASLFPEVDVIFKIFSPTFPSIQAVCDQINEKYFRYALGR